eukprot:8056774-Alexandrium_andersonii.AAC.1
MRGPWAPAGHSHPSSGASLRGGRRASRVQARRHPLLEGGAELQGRVVGAVLVDALRREGHPQHDLAGRARLF